MLSNTVIQAKTEEHNGFQMTNIILTDRKNTIIEVIRIMRYQVSLSAKGLKNIAKLGKGVSDPYAIVTLHSGDGTVEELGRTES